MLPRSTEQSLFHGVVSVAHDSPVAASLPALGHAVSLVWVACPPPTPHPAIYFLLALQDSALFPSGNLPAPKLLLCFIDPRLRLFHWAASCSVRTETLCPISVLFFSA